MLRFLLILFPSSLTMVFIIITINHIPSGGSKANQTAVHLSAGPWCQDPEGKETFAAEMKPASLESPVFTQLVPGRYCQCLSAVSQESLLLSYSEDSLMTFKVQYRLNPHCSLSSGAATPSVLTTNSAPNQA